MRRGRVGAQLGLHALDVTGPNGQPDGAVVAGDALAIINYINAFRAGPVPDNAAVGLPYGFLDTHLDDNVAPSDAIDVIKWKDIVEALEESVNAVEDVSDVVESILVKSS